MKSGFYEKALLWQNIVVEPYCGIFLGSGKYIR